MLDCGMGQVATFTLMLISCAKVLNNKEVSSMLVEDVIDREEGLGKL